MYKLQFKSALSGEWVDLTSRRDGKTVKTYDTMADARRAQTLNKTFARTRIVRMTMKEPR